LYRRLLAAIRSSSSPPTSIASNSDIGYTSFVGGCVEVLESSASRDAARLDVPTTTEALTQTLAKLSAEVPQLCFCGKPFALVAPEQRLQPPDNVACCGAEHEPRNAGDRRHLTEIQAELSDGMYGFHAGARDAFAVPPAAEIFRT